MSATADHAEERTNPAARLGFEPGQVVQEIGYDDDVELGSVRALRPRPARNSSTRSTTTSQTSSCSGSATRTATLRTRWWMPLV